MEKLHGNHFLKLFMGISNETTTRGFTIQTTDRPPPPLLLTWADVRRRYHGGSTSNHTQQSSCGISRTQNGQQSPGSPSKYNTHELRRRSRNNIFQVELRHCLPCLDWPISNQSPAIYFISQEGQGKTHSNRHFCQQRLRLDKGATQSPTVLTRLLLSLMK